jgi:hypothetical protein
VREVRTGSDLDGRGEGGDVSAMIRDQVDTFKSLI